MITKESPIGVIDSGIGGFSVARKVQKLMPHENLLYLGDGANTPYGNHSAEEILTMTRYMLRFMEEHSVKALLVACNTISCLIDQYRDEMSCPVLSVVQAGCGCGGPAARPEGGRDFHLLYRLHPLLPRPDREGGPGQAGHQPRLPQPGQSGGAQCGQPRRTGRY